MNCSDAKISYGRSPAAIGGSPGMAVATVAVLSSPLRLAVAVIVTARGGVQQQPSFRGRDIAGSGGPCALAVTPLGYPCEEHQAEKELKERKLLWDQEQKIMFCDMSNMDESQRACVKAMRKQIAVAKEASVKASRGGSTSEQGSGGDAEEAESLM
ncbi:unnamed protein product [Urochloa humidicola]